MIPLYRTIDAVARVVAKANTWLQKKTLRAAIGTLNSLLWAIAKSTGFLVFKGDRWDVDYGRLLCFTRCDSVTISIQWIGKNLAKQGWLEGDTKNFEESGRKQVERFLDTLQDLGLWGHRDSVLVGKKNTPCMHEGFNVILLMMVIEALERLYIQKYGIEDLPKHRGAIVQTLFNAVFKGQRQYNRVQQQDDLDVMPMPELTPLERAANEWFQYRERERACVVVCKGKHQSLAPYNYA